MATDATTYHVTYTSEDNTAPEWHAQQGDVIETLEEALLTCRATGWGAQLFDADGFRRGWVNAGGASWALS
jgi:hypothetical protein